MHRPMKRARPKAIKRCDPNNHASCTSVVGALHLPYFIERDIRPQPSAQMREVKTIGFIQACDKGIGGIGIRRQPRTIDLKERIGGRESDALVAVNECMVLGE